MPGRMSKAMSYLNRDFRKRQSYQSCAKILQSFGRKKRRLVDARFAIEQRAHSIA
jgi:hypothetical protein